VKRKELLRKLGIVILSAMVMIGTVAAPTYIARAGESGSTSTAAETEPSGGGDSGGGSDDGGGESTGGGSDDGGGESTGGGSDDGGGDNTSGGSDDGGGDNTGGGSDDGGGESTGGGSDDGGGESTGGGSDDSGEGSSGGNDDSGEGNTDAGTGSGAGSTEEGSETASTTEESELGGTDSTAEIGATIDPSIAATEEPAAEDELGEPEGYAEAENHNGTNEDLIAHQHIVTDMPIIRKDFRFTTVDKVYAFSAKEIEIREAREDSAEVVGRIAKNGVLFELEEEENGWIFVESGKVRGFVRGEDLIRGEDADQMREALEKQAERISRMLPEGISKDAYFFMAQETVPYYENEAYAFRRITTEDTVISKKPALAKAEIGIMESRDQDAREAGKLSEGGLCYVIDDVSNGWVFVESGDVRGFVKASDLEQGSAAEAKVEEAGEDALNTAVEEIKPADNKATYYTITSIKEGAKYNEVREKILEKALSCVGNPYVWGGTSLTHGADCSGFVQSLYALFGYHLPRVAAAQSGVGTQIPVSDAAPGDLIFFARNGYVYHVAMYAGDGKTVEAYSSQYGIITKELSERNAVWATRIIED
jgi:cell wall-associated NlpC family hydrolase